MSQELNLDALEREAKRLLDPNNLTEELDPGAKEDQNNILALIARIRELEMDKRIVIAQKENIEAVAKAAAERAQPSGEAVKPAAWMHTMDNTEGIEGNEPQTVITTSKRNPFGKPGVDYSKSYPVTSTPLYAAPPAAANPAVVPEDQLDARRYRWMIANVATHRLWQRKGAWFCLPINATEGRGYSTAGAAIDAAMLATLAAPHTASHALGGGD